MKVEHDSDRGRFFIRLGDEEAHLDYRREGDILDFTSIFVPPAHRGKSYAGKILIEAFEFAKQERCKVVPTCPFIAHDFLPRFPQYQELTAPDR